MNKVLNDIGINKVKNKNIKQIICYINTDSFIFYLNDDNL